MSEPRRPNFVLFNPDEWRADCAGCYGDPVVRTPPLDGAHFPPSPWHDDAVHTDVRRRQDTAVRPKVRGPGRGPPRPAHQALFLRRPPAD